MHRAGSEPRPEGTYGWREVRRVASTGSTNADLAGLAAAGEPAGLVLVAGEQTAGRGRLGRTWTAPAGTGLTFSLLLRPRRDVAALGWLPLLTGVAVAAAVRSAVGLEAALKWPNDVMVGERKLGGILAERVGGGAGGSAVVVGVGLNVSLRATDLPVPTATSVLIETGTEPDPGTLLAAVLEQLAERYGRWDSPAGDPDLAADYRAACSTLGRTVRADLPGGVVVEGLAVDLDAAGRLLVFTAEGFQPVGAGDVVHLR